MTHLRKIITQWILLTITTFAWAQASPHPVWDLSSNEIPPELQSGHIERVNGTITLKAGAAFAVPADAFKDPKNYTVQVTASINEFVENARFTAMKKQGTEDSGFSFSMNYRSDPWYARAVFTVVNNVVMRSNGIGGKSGPKLNTPYTFTLSLRDGFASFYIDGVPYKKCYMEVTPNNEPMWIGRNIDEDKLPMDVTISEVKVYGPDFVYTSDKETEEEHPRGVVAGKGWALDVPQVEHPEWPKVMIYGDSISMGYQRYLIPDLLEAHAYLFHCVHFINGHVPQQPMAEMAASYPFDAIVFNNGLHSLHWTPDQVSDEEIYKRMSQLAQSFKKGAPQAKIFYLMTTPHTAKRPAPNQEVNALGEKNDIVIRLNDISRQVMQDEGIEIIDVYSILADRLELASGDQYHWKGPAYEIISNEIQKKLRPVLKIKTP
ncbi:SGNH/GDSL hydrolase family protein [Coraliomargarita algicola]|uniref:SGNH/GDSL hydrolase family protein n=1 Tax=Coraliomargarita algicola TaxID=3092156 RepID=A0ABZ0RRB8_9BACT|nr:SGNH/GDSL hydrolase family protein [Coraliomargarita sp. J2-16]WPJ97340.1 SGNH/GDSL hydrolase family protein [Coraliomargarita sp. J2-16]